ncbi:MAG: hypothetical protein B7Y40_06010 [Gammaproteobacteria bacterium 28-57-27]|nr:MAG: hypothetical protein B7Y40_06010 [Gammaproteobacteria bacterium 28-57-27]
MTTDKKKRRKSHFKAHQRLSLADAALHRKINHQADLIAQAMPDGGLIVPTQCPELCELLDAARSAFYKLSKRRARFIFKHFGKHYTGVAFGFDRLQVLNRSNRKTLATTSLFFL